MKEIYYLRIDRYQMKDCLLEGTLHFMKVDNAINPFEYATKDVRGRNLFNQSMRDHTALVVKKILDPTNHNFKKRNK